MTSTYTLHVGACIYNIIRCLATVYTTISNKCMYNYFSNKFQNKLSYMEITKLQIVFFVLHIVFSFLTEDLPHDESCQLLLNCF